jgi:hypothetical protein
MRKMGARTFAELVTMAAKLDPARAPMRRNAHHASGQYDGVAATIVQ